MEALPITIPKDTFDFIQRWKQKKSWQYPLGPLECLEHYFDRFFTSFVLYNFLYDEICDKLQLKWTRDSEKAAKAAWKLLGASAIFADPVIHQGGEKIRTLIKSDTFYVRDQTWDKQRIAKLTSTVPEQWVSGLLEIVYGIRCNTFHGRKSFEEFQKTILNPCIDVIERLNDMLIEKIHT